MTTLTLSDLLTEYERAIAYSDLLWQDLSEDDVRWRPSEESSAIGWHLGHQAAVAHFMVRNLIAAEPSPDPELEPVMDSATPERQRGELPSVERIAAYRSGVAERLRVRIATIDKGDLAAANQLRIVATGLLVAIINHEYQHDQWIGEVRSGDLGRANPPRPDSPLLTTSDGYLVVATHQGVIG